MQLVPEGMAPDVTIWKLGRTVCVYAMVQRREKEKDSRYTEGIGPCSKTVYQTCNIMYICNTGEQLISVQTDMQTDVKMETNMDMDLGVKSLYIGAFSPREISYVKQAFLASKVTASRDRVTIYCAVQKLDNLLELNLPGNGRCVSYLL
jgi:hypothetical protein